jgi:hypothetical protein
MLGFDTVTNFNNTNSNVQNMTYFSPSSPEISQVNMILVNCNLINSGNFSNFVSQFFAIPISNINYGMTAQLGSNLISYSSINSSTYQYLELILCDQYNNKITNIRDKDNYFEVTIYEKIV